MKTTHLSLVIITLAFLTFTSSISAQCPSCASEADPATCLATNTDLIFTESFEGASSAFTINYLYYYFFPGSPWQGLDFSTAAGGYYKYIRAKRSPSGMPVSFASDDATGNLFPSISVSGAAYATQLLDETVYNQLQIDDGSYALNFGYSGLDQSVTLTFNCSEFTGGQKYYLAVDVGSDNRIQSSAGASIPLQFATSEGGSGGVTVELDGKTEMEEVVFEFYPPASCGSLCSSETFQVTLTRPGGTAYAGMILDRLRIYESKSSVCDVSVNPGIDVVYGDVCNNEGSVELFDYLLGTPSMGGTWSGSIPVSGGDTGTVDVSSSPGSHTMTYTVETEAGGTISSCVEIFVKEAPEPPVVVEEWFICENSSGIEMEVEYGNCYGERQMEMLTMEDGTEINTPRYSGASPSDTLYSGTTVNSIPNNFFIESIEEVCVTFDHNYVAGADACSDAQNAIPPSYIDFGIETPDGQVIPLVQRSDFYAAGVNGSEVTMCFRDDAAAQIVYSTSPTAPDVSVPTTGTFFPPAGAMNDALVENCMNNVGNTMGDWQLWFHHNYAYSGYCVTDWSIKYTARECPEPTLTTFYPDNGAGQADFAASTLSQDNSVTSDGNHVFDPIANGNLDSSNIGIYMYHATSTCNGCESEASKITVTILPEIVLSVVYLDCDGNPDGDMDPTNDNDEYTYQVTATFPGGAPPLNTTLDVLSMDPSVSQVTGSMSYNITTTDLNQDLGIFTAPADGAALTDAITVGWNGGNASSDCNATLDLDAQDPCSCFQQLCSSTVSTSGLFPDPTDTEEEFNTMFVLVDATGVIEQIDDVDDTDIDFDLTQIPASDISAGLCKIYAINYDQDDPSSQAIIDDMVNDVGIGTIDDVKNDVTYCDCLDVSFGACYIKKIESPLPPITSGTRICQGESTAILEASSNPSELDCANYNWYDVDSTLIIPDDITGMFDPLLNSSNGDVLAGRAGTYTFYATCENSNDPSCESVLQPVTLIIDSLAQTPLLEEDCICADSALPSIRVNPISTGSTYNVYTSSSATSPTLSSVTAPIDISTLAPADVDNTTPGVYTLYVSEITADGCETGLSAYTLNVLDLPTAVVADDAAELCATDAALNLNSHMDGGMTTANGNWFLYDEVAGGVTTTAVNNQSGTAPAQGSALPAIFDPTVYGPGTYQFIYVVESASSNPDCPNCSIWAGPITVEVLDSPTLTAVPTAPQCAEDPAEVELTTTNGVANYDYALNNGTSMLNNANATVVFPNLSAGSYTASVTDASGCVADVSFVISPALDIEFEIESQSFICSTADPIPLTYSLPSGDISNPVYSVSDAIGGGTEANLIGTYPTLEFDPTLYDYGTYKIVFSGEYDIDGDGPGTTVCAISDSTIIAVGPCAPPYEFSPSDPCVCNDDASVNGDDGTFSEVVVIQGSNGDVLPPGQTWTATYIVGAFDDDMTAGPGATGAAVAAGASFTYCGTPGGCVVDGIAVDSGGYYLLFDHVDNVGYTVVAEGPTAVGGSSNFILSISNTCFYPEASVTGPTEVCENDGAVTIQGIPSSDGSNTVTFDGDATYTSGTGYTYTALAGLTDNGDGTATFDPGDAGAGCHTISYTVMDEDNPGLSEPGCISVVEYQVLVYPQDDPTFAIPDSIACDAGDLVLSLGGALDAWPQCDAEAVPTDGERVRWYGGNVSDNGLAADADGLFTNPSVTGNYTICVETGVGACTQVFCQDIMIIDTIAPVVSGGPADQFDLTCDTSMPDLADLADFTVTSDDCNGNVTFEVAQYNIGIPTCPSSLDTILRVYSFYDESGNVTRDSVLYTYALDNEVPTLDGTAPADIVLDCDETTPAVPTVTFSDNCDVAVDVIFFETTSPSASCPGATILSRTWRGIDDCGNVSADVTQVVTIEDATNPVMDPILDLSVACGADISGIVANWLGSVSATDNCALPSISNDWDGSLPDACGGVSTVTIVFTATDLCGNTTTAEADIIAETDMDPPTWPSDPQDLTVTCVALQSNASVLNVWLDSAGNGQAADDCGAVAYSNDYAALSDDCGMTGSATVIFTATDDCGNSSTREAVFTVIDDTPPTIDIPAQDNLVECDGAGNAVELQSWLDNNGFAISTDGCGDITWNTPVLLNTIPGCGDTEELIYEFSSTDDCGNVSNSTTGSFIIEDTTSPVIDPAAEDMTVACDGGAYLVDMETWLANNGGAVAADDCGTMTWSYVLVAVSEQCPGTGAGTYRFTATDDCGNTATTEATFLVEDLTVPVITVEATDLVQDCNGSNNTLALLDWLNTNGGAEATDECSDITWSNNYGTIVGGCAGTGSVPVTFIAMDACGNESITVAELIINDFTDPVWTLDPVDLAVECTAGADPMNAIMAWLDTAAGGEAEDECSVIVYSNDFSGLINGCAATSTTGAAIVTFTATDGCGNFTTRQAVVEVVDSTPPEIDSPAQDLTVECDGAGNTIELAAWLASNASALTSDVCGNAVWDTPVLVSTTGGCGSSEEYLYAFSSTDDCGNTSVVTTATFTIEDTTSPSLDTPAANMTVDCDGGAYVTAMDAWIANNGGAVMSDICGNVTWTYDLIGESDECQMIGTGLFRFTATDDCGNTSIAEASFTVRDITPPVVTVSPLDLDVDCNGSNNSAQLLSWLNTNGGAVATDECSTVTWSNDYGTIVSGCGATGAVTVTFTATDGCGNTSTEQATLTINDNTAPVWTLDPTDLNLECTADADPQSAIDAWVMAAGNGESEDECSVIIYSNDYAGLSAGCGANSTTGTALVIFTATDACGNFSTKTATVTVSDNTPPSIDFPAQDELVECDGAGNIADLNAWLASDASAVATDICGNVIWNAPVLVSTTNGCGSGIEYVYSFTATDDCGNVSAATTATFKIQDTTAPILTAASDLVVDCDGGGYVALMDSWIASNGGASAADDCSAVSWSYDLVRENDFCPMTGIGTYRFTATDACGNSSTSEAEFTVRDITPPVIVGGADMAMGECSPVQPSGNYPEFDYWLESNAGATATDECSSISWTNDFTPANWVQSCGNSRSVTVVFTAADACGNESTVTHTWGIGDTTAPVFQNCPRPPIVGGAPETWCSAFMNFSLPVATDNCDASVIITQMDNTGLSTGSLFPVGTSELVFEATDACGNSTECSIKVVVNDFHSPPEITSCPGDITAMCGDPLPNLGITFEDNCPDNSAVIWEITDEGSQVLASGMESIGGNLPLPTGNHSVRFKVQDQPLILITELVQSGTDMVEISNLGPASVDLNCLEIKRYGLGVETVILPMGTILAPGATYVHTFTSDIAYGDAAGYTIEYMNTIFDAVATNGYATLAPWSGVINGGDVCRIWNCDHDTSADWKVTMNCTQNIGQINGSLDVMTDNGSTTSLQSQLPAVVECGFELRIEDDEAPVCVEIVQEAVAKGGSQALPAGSCIESTVTISQVFNVDYIQINGLEITHPNVSDLSVYLTGPNGIRVKIFDGLCANTADVLVSISDTTGQQIITAPCGALGAGGWYSPIESLQSLTDVNSSGEWTLTVMGAGLNSGNLVDWELQLYSFGAYAQTDVDLEVTQLAGSDYSWTHPLQDDNCCAGSILMDIVGPDGSNSSQTVIGGSNITEYFLVGCSTVTYTMSDCLGNKSQCSFDVCITDDFLPASCCDDQFLCISQLNVSLNQDCTTEFSPSMGGIGLMCNASFYSIELMDEDGNVMLDGDGNNLTTLGIDHINRNLTYRIFNNDPVCSGNSCWGNLLVEYKHLPQIDCPVDMTLSCGALDVLPLPDVSGSEACNTEAFEIYLANEVREKLECGEPGAEDYTHVVTRTYIATDALGNTASCEHTILLERIDLSGLEFPGNAQVNCSELGNFILADSGVPLPWLTAGLTGFGSAGVPVICHPDIVTTTGLVCPSNGSGEGIPLIPQVGATMLSEDGPELILGDIVGNCSAAITYTDVMLPQIGCTQKALRTWEIREWYCADEIPIGPHIQVIEIVDDMAPVIECPSPFVVTTNDACAGDVDLPAAVVSDGCNNGTNVTIEHPWGLITGNGGTASLEVGVHILQYKAADNCYNQATCSTTVTIRDNTQPIAICEQSTVVSISQDGNTFVSSDVFDDGSWDECGAVKTCAMKMDDVLRFRSLSVDTVYLGTAYVLRDRMDNGCLQDYVAGVSLDGLDYISEDDLCISYVRFCCTDVGLDLMVVFRASDHGGNFSDCMVTVEVQDKAIPNLECPADATIDCRVPYVLDNLNLQFGTATVIDNCAALQPVSETVDSDVNQCGLGTIVRLYEIKDGFGQVLRSCKQHIEIVNETPFTGDIQWPLDFEASCGAASGLTPETLSAPYSVPTFLSGDDQCSLLGYDYKDQYFAEDPITGECGVIRRSWTVIDWCSSINGEFTNYPLSGAYVQTIKISNDVAPELAAQSAQVFTSNSIDCNSGEIEIIRTATDDCTAAIDLDWTYTLRRADGTIDTSGNSRRLTGTFAAGDYSIEWSACDGCGNCDTDTQELQIVNTKAPIPICMNGLSISLDNNGLAELWDTDIDGGSYHPCDNAFTIGFNSETTQRGLTFDCTHEGTQLVSLYVRDAITGINDFCVATVEIQDPLDACTVQRQVAIHGEVYTEDLNYVEDVELELAANMPMEMTDSQGQYAFESMPMGGSYRLAPKKDVEYLNGVSTLDLILMQRHILGLEALDSPYKLIAADVNGSKDINGIDLVELRKLILGIYSELPANDSWRFLDAAYKFDNQENPWLDAIAEAYEIEKLSTDMDIDFIGVKIGDVNGSVVASSELGEFGSRNSRWPLVLEFAEVTLEEDELTTIPVYGRNYESVSGWQTSVEFDSEKLEIVEIVGGVLELTTENYNYDSQEEGWMTLSYGNTEVEAYDKEEVLFQLVVRAKERTTSAEQFVLSSRVTKSEAYRGFREIVDLIGDSRMNEEVSINSVNPNPWITTTEIEFIIPETGKGIWEFYDVNGRLLHKITNFYEAGKQLLKLDRTDINAAGIVYMKLTTDQGVAEHKMILIK